MTETELSLADLAQIRESLEYSIHKCDSYSGYPSYEFKQQRLSELHAVKTKVSAQIKELKGRGR